MKPEYFDFDEYKTRQAKLKEISELGIEPYPHSCQITHAPIDLVGQYSEDDPVGTFDEALSGSTDHVIIGGRIILHRCMGKNIFAQVQEDGARIQVLFNRDKTKVVGLENEEKITAHKFLEKKLDLGDFISVEGHLFRTQKGELTIFAHKVTLLCKSLLPLPDKHSGLKDKELRYRKRWNDLICNPEVLNTFRMRSKIITLIRSYLAKSDFLEVETPALQTIYGGANAKPFMTHLNALHLDMYLRIALEIPLKKLIVGGMSRVYEIGRNYRNEGLDATHNPEFTMLECYAAYWDYNDMMKLTEELFALISKELFGTTKLTRKDRDGNEHEIDLKTPWTRLTMKESIKKYADFDVDRLSDEKMREILVERTHFDEEKVSKLPRGILIFQFFDEFVEKKLIQPVHITDHPKETTPLCKLHRDPKCAEEGIVERFESFMLGTELCNAYTELNDPNFQRELLEAQERLLLAGDEEANPVDEEFLEAIAQGMPPTGGLGIGIDRLVMLFADAHSIRDVLLFPAMKPEKVLEEHEATT